MTTDQQAAICRRFGVPSVALDPAMKVGLARNGGSGLRPVNGLRHPPEGDSSGWFIWAGEELAQDPDFFQPVHIAHLEALCPAAVPYLALPPGWRFLIDGDHEDVWEDATLLSPK